MPEDGGKGSVSFEEASECWRADAAAPGAPQGHPDFDALVRTIWRLRQPDGCPWDRAQTHESIALNAVEEAYEVVDAIEGSSQRHLAEELGDLLMQVVLHAQIADDDGEFDIDDVCRSINEKLIRRHPHVFGSDQSAETPEEVRDIWSRVKLDEYHSESGTPSAGETPAPESPREATESQVDEATCERPGLLDGVPSQLPALMACQKISRKAAAAGFEWETVDAVWEQVRSEIAEYNAEEPGSAAASVEFGDILFALVNVARWQGIDAESSLRASNAKFRRRWAYLEHKAWESGREITDLSNSEQEALWAEAKSKEKKQ